jgi:hypothetical protein
VFFPGVRSQADATPLDIDYGTARESIDFQVGPVRAVRVSGRLEGAAPPFPETLLRLLPAGSERLGFGAEAATTVVARDGTFSFLNVPEGSYALLAQASVMDFTSGNASIRLADAPGFPGGGIAVGSMDGAPGLGFLTRSGQASPYWGRTSVHVGSADLGDVVVPLRPAVKVSGRIVFAEGTAPPPGPLMLTAQPANGDPTLGQPRGSTQRNDPTFEFTIQNLLGGRYLLVSDQFSYPAVSVIWEGKDVATSGFDGSLGRDFDDVVVTVTDKTTEIAGTVVGLRGRAHAAVIAFPVDQARWTDFGWSPSWFRTARARSEGSFQLQYLPAGEYFLVAVDAEHVNAWTDRSFLERAAPLASRVSLKWGEKKTQTLTLVTMAAR